MVSFFILKLATSLIVANNSQKYNIVLPTNPCTWNLNSVKNTWAAKSDLDTDKWKKKFFSIESEDQHQNFRGTKEILHIRGVCPILDPSTVTLKFPVLSISFLFQINSLCISAAVLKAVGQKFLIFLKSEGSLQLKKLVFYLISDCF